jgi:starvation-inducible outer membrane lipoprotein
MSEYTKGNKMNIKIGILALLTALAVAACSNSPAPKKEPYGSADSQRERAHQTQGELSSETRNK